MNSPPSSQRAGTVLVCVLACSAIALTLGASAVHLALKSARASRQVLDLRQTQWLLDAGVQRSRTRFSLGNYDDEQWQVPETVLPNGKGTVNIDLERTTGGVFVITVTAEYRRRTPSPFSIRRSFSYQQISNSKT